MFTTRQKITYINPMGHTISHLIIEQVQNGVVHITSGSVGGMGPFDMTFDEQSGKGVGDYVNSYIVDGYRKIPTLIQLGEWISKHTNIERSNDVSIAMLEFVAMQNAEVDISRKDFAEMLISGITPMDNDDVDEWLRVVYEDFDIEEAEAYILQRLVTHFNTAVESL